MDAKEQFDASGHFRAYRQIIPKDSLHALQVVHEGRRVRQGAMMGAPDYAHWHGFFELQQDLYKLEQIYQRRMDSGEIE